MKKLLKKLYEDRAVFSLVLLVAVTVLIMIVYDIVYIVSGTVDPDKHLPFFVPIVVSVISAIAISALRRRSPAADIVEGEP